MAGWGGQKRAEGYGQFTRQQLSADRKMQIAATYPVRRGVISNGVLQQAADMFGARPMSVVE